MSSNKQDSLQTLIEKAEAKLRETNKKIIARLQWKTSILNIYFEPTGVKDPDLLSYMKDYDDHFKLSKNLELLSMDEYSIYLLNKILERQKKLMPKTLGSYTIDPNNGKDIVTEELNKERSLLLKELEDLKKQAQDSQNNLSDNNSFDDMGIHIAYLNIHIALLVFSIFIVLASAAVLTALYLPEHMPNAIAGIVAHLTPLTHEIILGSAYAVGALGILAMLYAIVTICYSKKSNFSFGMLDTSINDSTPDHNTNNFNNNYTNDAKNRSRSGSKESDFNFGIFGDSTKSSINDNNHNDFNPIDFNPIAL